MPKERLFPSHACPVGRAQQMPSRGPGKLEFQVNKEDSAGVRTAPATFRTRACRGIIHSSPETWCKGTPPPGLATQLEAGARGSPHRGVQVGLGRWRWQEPCAVEGGPVLPECTWAPTGHASPSARTPGSGQEVASRQSHVELWAGARPCLRSLLPSHPRVRPCPEAQAGCQGSRGLCRTVLSCPVLSCPVLSQRACILKGGRDQVSSFHFCRGQGKAGLECVTSQLGDPRGTAGVALLPTSPAVCSPPCLQLGLLHSRAGLSACPQLGPNSEKPLPLA